jgi:hypothetical protein
MHSGEKEHLLYRKSQVQPKPSPSSLFLRTSHFRALLKVEIPWEYQSKTINVNSTLLAFQTTKLTSHTGWTTLIDWKKATDDAAVRQVSIDTTSEWKRLGQARGLWLPYLFMNDASRDQNPIASYGADNIAKLKRIALKYDPSELFQKLQSNGFLLSKV